MGRREPQSANWIIVRDRRCLHLGYQASSWVQHASRRICLLSTASKYLAIIRILNKGAGPPSYGSSTNTRGAAWRQDSKDVMNGERKRYDVRRGNAPCSDPRVLIVVA